MTKYQTSCDECGWTSTPTTSEARAAHALRIHSCELHRTRQEQAARTEARRAASGPVAPCTCKRVQHEHGDRVRYVIDGCRCRACRDALRVYENERNRLHLYGRWNGLVDAEPVRTHVRSLMAAGMGWKRIAQAAGITTSTVYPILYGKPDRPPRVRVQPHVADALLTVTLDLAGGALVPAFGAARRVQALVALGWSQSKLATRLGVNPSSLNNMVSGHLTRITAAHERDIRRLYDELAMTLPPEDTWRDKIAASRARNYARGYGWRPPLAWDDDELDDPDATPRTAGGARVSSAQKLPPADDIAWLLEQGEPIEQVAVRFGVTTSAVTHALNRSRTPV